MEVTMTNHTFTELTTHEFMSVDFRRAHGNLHIKEYAVDAQGRSYVIVHNGTPLKLATIQRHRKHKFVRMELNTFLRFNFLKAAGVQRIEIAKYRNIGISDIADGKRGVWITEQHVLTPELLRELQLKLRAENNAKWRERKGTYLKIRFSSKQRFKCAIMITQARQTAPKEEQSKIVPLHELEKDAKNHYKQFKKVQKRF